MLSAADPVSSADTKSHETRGCKSDGSLEMSAACCTERPSLVEEEGFFLRIKSELSVSLPDAD